MTDWVWLYSLPTIPSNIYNVVSDGKIAKAIAKTGAVYVLAFLNEKLEEYLFESLISQIVHQTYISAINTGNLSILKFFDKKMSIHPHAIALEIGLEYFIFLSYLRRNESDIFACYYN